jgi:hypothetical protein
MAPPLDDSNAAPYEDMGPSLLASQPPSLTSPDAVPGKNWGTIFAYLEQRFSSLRAWRWSWWAYWSVVATFVLPRRYHWLIVSNRMARGAPINDAIIDSTATLAMQTCAGGMWTGLTSPSRPWFKVGIALPWIKPTPEAMAWLEDTEQRIYTVFAQSNFYSIMAQAFQDVATFGTAPVIIYEDHEDVIRCYLPCAGEYYLASGARLSTDTLFREFTFTVAQIVEMFTLEKCPFEIRSAWETGGGELDTEYVVCHAIEPNFALAGRGDERGKSINVVPSLFTFREVYWLKGQKLNAELSRRGFHERPFMTAKWFTVSNDPYGRSPAMDALGDVKQVQLETRRKAEYVDKGVRPPMGADPALKNEPSSILPGNITYTDATNGKKGFWPLFEVGPQWLPAIGGDIDKVNARVERCFFVDLFMAISRMEGVQPRNELELTKRDLERLQTLGPVISLFETEFAGPAVQRVMGILNRRRALMPIPKSLRGVPLKVDFVSIMRLAQRSAESVSLKDTLQTGGELSAAAKASGLPDPLRILNLDEAMREVVSLNNNNPVILFTEEQVAKQDAERAATLAKAHQQVQAPAALQAGVDAAKTLSDTKIDPGNALGAILSRGGGAPIAPTTGGQ